MIDFKDPAITPNEELIATVLGERMKWWNMLMDATIGKDPAMTGVWRYYNDGKSWLFRILRKKNTIFWLTMQEDTFRITFYFGDKAIPLVESGDLSENEKESFRNAPRFGAIRGVSILMEREEDIQTVLKWVIIKLQIK